MGTREDCMAGDHTSDNQGLCHWCGAMVNQEWYDAYMGIETPPPFDVAIRSANELIASDKAIESVGIIFTTTTGEVYQGEWDGRNFLSLKKAENL